MATDFPWDDSRLIAPLTVHHIRIGERPTLYCETAKQLFGLNPTADLIWRSLAEGNRPRDVQRKLANGGLADSDARDFVRSAVLSWLNSGHLTPKEVLDQLEHGGRALRHVRIHDWTAPVDFHGSSSAEAFDEVFGQFGWSESTPGVTISIVERGGQFFTFKDRQPLGVCTAEELIPRLVVLFREGFISSVRNAFLIHAAFVMKRKRGILLCGLPRAGKTTFCAALVGSGYEYASDDLVRVEQNGQATGIPFAPAVKEGAWPIIARYAPKIANLPTYRRGDGQYVRYLPVQSAGAPSGEIDCVLLLARQEGVATALQAIEPLEVVWTILETAFSPKGAIEPDALKGFARRIEAARCYRIAYSEIEAAVRAVDELLA